MLPARDGKFAFNRIKIRPVYHDVERTFRLDFNRFGGGKFVNFLEFYVFIAGIQSPERRYRNISFIPFRHEFPR